MRIHLAGEHALELEFLDLALEAPRIGLDVVDRGSLGLRLGELEQLERSGDAVPDAIEPRGERLELGALLAERLGALRRLPDLGIF